MPISRTERRGRKSKVGPYVGPLAEWVIKDPTLTTDELIKLCKKAGFSGATTGIAAAISVVRQLHGAGRLIPKADWNLPTVPVADDLRWVGYSNSLPKGWVRGINQRLPWVGYLAKMDGKRVAQTSRHLFTSAAWARAITKMRRHPPSEVAEFLGLLKGVMPGWEGVVVANGGPGDAKAVGAAQLRKQGLLSSTALALFAVGQLGARTLDQSDWRDRVYRLEDVDWRIRPHMAQWLELRVIVPGRESEKPFRVACNRSAVLNLTEYLYNETSE